MHSHIFKLPTHSSTKVCFQSYVCTGIPGIRYLQVSLIKVKNFYKKYGKYHRFSFKLSLKEGYYRFWLGYYERPIIPPLSSLPDFKGRFMLLLNRPSLNMDANQNKRFKREHFSVNRVFQSSAKFLQSLIIHLLKNLEDFGSQC